jgi:hypothetical protein
MLRFVQIASLINLTRYRWNQSASSILTPVAVLEVRWI